MGYRTYLGKLSKKEYNEMKNLSTIEEVYTHYGKTYEKSGYGDYIGVYDIIKKSVFYIGGRYPIEKIPKNSTKPFFNNEEVNNEWNKDSDLMVVNKEFVEYLIREFTNNVKTYYKDLLSPLFSIEGKSIKKFMDTGNVAQINVDDVNNLFRVVNHVRSVAGDWGEFTFPNILPYDLSESNENICKSGRYEYCIFDLVRIYKTFNWKKDILVYYGY
jgi:hypothetical protein